MFKNPNLWMVDLIDNLLVWVLLPLDAQYAPVAVDPEKRNHYEEHGLCLLSLQNTQ